MAAPQGVYPCAGEDRWIALAVTTDEQWGALRSVLDDPAWAQSDRLTHHEGRRLQHDRIDRELSAWTAQHPVDDVIGMLLTAGIPSAAVVPPRDLAANPQLRFRLLFETEHHAITGDHEIPMVPFRFSRVDRWLRFPAPTLGQHNDEVLREIGYADAAIRHLRGIGIVGEVPNGP